MNTEHDGKIWPLPDTVAFPRPESQQYPQLESADYGTDLDASLRFAEEVENRLRYCLGIGWLSWDGKRWAKDGADHRAIEHSKHAARRWTELAGKNHDEGRAARIKIAELLADVAVLDTASR